MKSILKRFVSVVVVALAKEKVTDLSLDGLNIHMTVKHVPY